MLASVETGGQAGPGFGALDGNDGALGGDVGAPQSVQDALGVGRVGHDIEALVVHPPDNDVVGHRTVVGQEVRVLRSTGSNLSKIVGELRCKRSKASGPGDAHGAQVAYVKDDRTTSARSVLGHRALADRSAAYPIRQTGTIFAPRVNVALV